MPRNTGTTLDLDDDTRQFLMETEKVARQALKKSSDKRKRDAMRRSRREQAATRFGVKQAWSETKGPDSPGTLGSVPRSSSARGLSGPLAAAGAASLPSLPSVSRSHTARAAGALSRAGAVTPGAVDPPSGSLSFGGSLPAGRSRRGGGSKRMPQAESMRNTGLHALGRASELLGASVGLEGEHGSVSLLRIHTSGSALEPTHHVPGMATGSTGGLASLPGSPLRTGASHGSAMHRDSRGAIDVEAEEDALAAGDDPVLARRRTQRGGPGDWAESSIAGASARSSMGIGDAGSMNMNGTGYGLPSATARSVEFLGSVAPDHSARGGRGGRGRPPSGLRDGSQSQSQSTWDTGMGFAGTKGKAKGKGKGKGGGTSSTQQKHQAQGQLTEEQSEALEQKRWASEVQRAELEQKHSPQVIHARQQDTQTDRTKSRTGGGGQQTTTTTTTTSIPRSPVRTGMMQGQAPGGAVGGRSGEQAFGAAFQHALEQGARGPGAGDAGAAFTASMREAAMQVGVPSWARADHAVDTRQSASLWADPTRATGTERGISSTAVELARTLDGAGGSRGIDWSTRSLQLRFRDEVARQRAYEAGRAATEEAQRLEEEEGIVVPVVQAQQHPLFRGVADIIASENRAARNAARERAARRVYTLDVRAVWLAGDLPADAPMAWRRAPYGGHAALVGGANRAGAPQYPEAEVARRALLGRRDEASLAAGHHQVQSVSLARAMEGAVATGEGHSDLVSVRHRGLALLDGAPPPLREPVQCGVAVCVPWLEQPAWLSLGDGPTLPADAASGLEAEEDEEDGGKEATHATGQSTKRSFAPGDDSVWGRVRLSLEVLVSAVVPAAEPGAGEEALEALEQGQGRVRTMKSEVASGAEAKAEAEAEAGTTPPSPREQQVAYFDDGRAVPTESNDDDDDDDGGHLAREAGRGMVLEASGVARGVVLEVIVPRMGTAMRCPVPATAFWPPLVQLLRGDAGRRASAREAAESALRRGREEIATAREARRAALGETEAEAAKQMLGGGGGESGAAGTLPGAAPMEQDISAQEVTNADVDRMAEEEEERSFPPSSEHEFEGSDASPVSMAVGAGSLVPASVGGTGTDAGGGDELEGGVPTELSTVELAGADEAAEEALAAGLVSALQQAREQEEAAYEALQWSLGAEAAAGEEIGVAFPRESVRLAAARAQRRARLDRSMGVAGRVGDPSVIGLDGADAVAVGASSAELPPLPNREAVSALLRLMRLVVAAESVPLPPRGTALRSWHESMRWSDEQGSSVRVFPGVGGVREPGRFDDGGRSTGCREFTLAYSGVAFGQGDIRRAQLEAGGPNLMSPKVWAALEPVAYPAGENATQGTENEPAPGLKGPRVQAPAPPLQEAWRHGPGAGQFLRGPGGEILRGDGASHGGAGPSIDRLPPHLRDECPYVPASVLLTGRENELGVVPGLTVVGRFESAALILHSHVGSGGELVGLIALAADDSLVDAGHLADEAEAREAAAHVTALARDDTGRDVGVGGEDADDHEEALSAGALRSVAFALMAAPPASVEAVVPHSTSAVAPPHALPAPETANDWALPPPVTAASAWAEDATDAPPEALGHRRSLQERPSMSLTSPLPRWYVLSQGTAQAPGRRGVNTGVFQARAGGGGRPAAAQGTDSSRAVWTPRSGFSKGEANGGPAAQTAWDSLEFEVEAPPGLGFRVMERSQLAARPMGGLSSAAFGVTQGAATPNTATVWKRRYTWHSDVAVRTGFTHTRDTFLHLLQNTSRTSGPSQPSVFTARLDFERLSRVDSTSLSEYFEEERLREEKRTELRRREQEAVKAREHAERAEARALERADLARQWRDKNIRDAARLRGTSVALGLARGEWESMRADGRARVTARHAGWERWVHVESVRDRGDQDGNGGKLYLENGRDHDHVHDHVYEHEHEEQRERGADAVVAVWYYHPEQEKSSWDPPAGWPEVDAQAADGGSLELALREDSLVAGPDRAVLALGDMGMGRDRGGKEDMGHGNAMQRDTDLSMTTNAMVAGAAPVLGAAPAEVVALATLRGAGAGAAADPLDDGEGAAMRAAAASGAVEECIYRAFERGFRRWAVETGCRSCVDPASVTGGGGGGNSSVVGGSEAGATVRHDVLAPGAAYRSMMEAATVVDDAEVSLDRGRRLTPMRAPARDGQGQGGASGDSDAAWKSAAGSLDQSIGGSSGMLAGSQAQTQDHNHGNAVHGRAVAWDDRDVATLTSGLEPGSGGETGTSVPWRPGKRDAFDLGPLLRLLDRDGDGVVSLRDWAKATGAETPPPMDAREAEREARRVEGRAPPPAPIRPEDRDASELLLASVWPYFCASLSRVMPPALRPLLEDTVPGLLDEDAREALGLPMGDGGSEDGDHDGEQKEQAQRDHAPPLRPLGQCDGTEDAAARLRSLLSPGVRLRLFLDVKRQRAFPGKGQRDRARAHTTYADWMRWACGSGEGADWFGLGSTLGLFLPVKQWTSGASLRTVAGDAAEFAPAIDPASGSIYWVSTRTGISVWSKGKPQLRADAAARFQAVARLDMEERAEERLCRAALRRTAAVARGGAAAFGTQQSDGIGTGRARGVGDGMGRGARRSIEGGERSSEYGSGSGSGSGLELVPAGAGRGGAPPASTADVVAQIRSDPALLSQLAAALGLPEPQQGDVGGFGIGYQGGSGVLSLGEQSGSGPGVATLVGGTAIGARITATEDRRDHHQHQHQHGDEADYKNRYEDEERDEDPLWGTEGSAMHEERPESAGPPGAPGSQWRHLRPPKDPQRLRARAREARVLGAQFSQGLNLPNVPAVVGLVAPVDVSVRVDTSPHPTPGPFMVGDLEGETETMKVVVDPRTGEKVVQSTDPGARSDDDQRAETIRLAFSLVRAGRTEELREVLGQGVLDMDLDRDDKGNSLVIIACQNGNKKVLKELLRRGADPNVRNSAGNTALHFLFSYGFRELGEYLISKGGDDTVQNNEGLTPHEGLSRAEVEAL